ncbi:MAG: acetate--CoA ligase family protein [Burkholderiales bacterium]|nr:acetate--CoA ligase family protein [Burkholderiales bacterium]
MTNKIINTSDSVSSVETRKKLAQALFAPRSVALIGASADASKNTARPQRFMRKHGYSGQIIPINPLREEVLGERAYPSLLEVPGGIDHAFIMLPAAKVQSAIEQCAARGVPVATVYSDGFAEAGEQGQELEHRLIDCARKLGVRILGPNSIGLVNVSNGAALSVNAVLEMESLPRGGASVISQSGTIIGTLLSRGAARGLGFAKLLSVGNEADLGVGELVDLLVDDPETKVILLFLETIRDAASLARASDRAFAAGKPVVAYKLGRSHLGEVLARSHTGALAGSDAAVDAYFQRCGIVRVDMLETLNEIVHRAPVALQTRPPCIAVVTTTGGGAASVVDRLGTLGMQTFTPDADLIAQLGAQGIPIKAAPLIDLTLAATSDKYRAVLEALILHPGCDAVLAVVGSSAQFHPALAVKPIVGIQNRAKPLAVFLAPHAQASLEMLAQAGIAAFRTPEGCADALNAYFSWRPPQPNSFATKLPWPENLPVTGSLDEAQSMQLFDVLGVPTVARVIAKAPDFSHDISYPVAIKVLSADILHKTEVGGVVLSVANSSAYGVAVPQMLSAVHASCPNATIEGVLVQSMAQGLAEVIVGYKRDELIGPVVMVGMGGRLAEIYRDTYVRCAPVDHAQALEMLNHIKGLALIRGYRGLPRGDVQSLAQVVVAVSNLALLHGAVVAEAEINPLLVQANGVLALDGVVILDNN